MHLVHILYRGRARKVRNTNADDWNLTSCLLAVCLLYLSAVVSADQYDWNSSSVPKGNYAALPIGPVYKPAVASSESRHAQPHIQNYNNHHHRYHQHHQTQQHVNSDSIARASQSGSSTYNDALSKSWYSSYSNDPRMVVPFITDSTSSSSSLLPVPSPTLQTFVPSPRSLSSLPSSLSSSSSPSQLTNSSSSNVTSNIRNSSGSKLKSKRKKKKQKKTGKSVNATLASSTEKPNATSEIMAASSKTELQTDIGSSRTFVLTPLLAFMFPVFIAQLFGMGMIPAAALITLPIFLLPIGLTAAVFLI